MVGRQITAPLLQRRRLGPTAYVPLHFGGATADGSMAAATRYMQHGGSTTTEADATRLIMPAAGTVDRLRVECKQANTGTMAVTVRKGGVATALAVGATAGTGAVRELNDLANSFAVAEGDYLTLEVVIATQPASVKTAFARFQAT